jgi:hypothetical protein
MKPTTWRQRLVERHPEVFVRAFRGVPFSPGYPTCSDGWRDIVTNVVERVSAAAAGRPVRFTRMSEEHGSLRIHWTAEADLPDGAELAIQDAVALAEARSACTCQTCGAEGSLYSSGSWLLTACPAHARGVPVPVRHGRENVHHVRGRISEDIGTIACRRYDRTTDRFVDVERSHAESENRR